METSACDDDGSAAGRECDDNEIEEVLGEVQQLREVPPLETYIRHSGQVLARAQEGLCGDVGESVWHRQKKNDHVHLPAHTCGTQTRGVPAVATVT